MRTVRNIVNTGRTIVCTIHQPSIDIFEAFDELLLLKRGGELIFNGQLGKDSKRLIQYFSVCGLTKCFPQRLAVMLSLVDSGQLVKVNSPRIQVPCSHSLQCRRDHTLCPSERAAYSEALCVLPAGSGQV